ncbi:MAG: hypothetical protein HY814_11880 [Candidatus Riflebacteria bacterium]|nr:hypothetical protein [Candidatus Riflebacteria bacterium]
MTGCPVGEVARDGADPLASEGPHVGCYAGEGLPHLFRGTQVAAAPVGQVENPCHFPAQPFEVIVAVDVALHPSSCLADLLAVTPAVGLGPCLHATAF